MIKDLWLVLTGKLSSRQLKVLEESISHDIYETRHSVAGILATLDSISHSTTQLVAKLAPEYLSEDDPIRTAASQRIANEQILRLKAEDWARKHTLGEA